RDLLPGVTEPDPLAHFALGGMPSRPLSSIIDESIDHDADVSVANTPVISQWTTFAAKSEAFDESRRGHVVRMDQSFDPMNVELVDTVLEHSLSRRRIEARHHPRRLDAVETTITDEPPNHGDRSSAPRTPDRSSRRLASASPRSCVCGTTARPR